MLNAGERMFLDTFFAQDLHGKWFEMQKKKQFDGK